MHQTGFLCHILHPFYMTERSGSCNMIGKCKAMILTLKLISERRVYTGGQIEKKSDKKGIISSDG